MNKDSKLPARSADIIPFRGRDEMNLIEFPFGPISPTEQKTLEVEQTVFDRYLKREVTRRLIMTGSDCFGLPRPVDERVLVGLMTLTYEAGFASPRVEFSAYHLCRTIGWNTSGSAYRRLEESFDRLAGTYLKFKNAWYDQGGKEWVSKGFHLIESFELCTLRRLRKKRVETKRAELSLCHFVWNDVIWKSFGDGFIKPVDMEMFRRIGRGRKRDVPLRLFRLLDKKFYKTGIVRFGLDKLAINKLGLSPAHPSELIRPINRAVRVLTDCGFLERAHYDERTRTVSFYKKRSIRTRPRKVKEDRRPVNVSPESPDDNLKVWLEEQSSSELSRAETEALAADFGTPFERRLVHDDRHAGKSILDSGFVRQDYVRRFLQTQAAA